MLDVTVLFIPKANASGSFPSGSAGLMLLSLASLRLLDPKQQRVIYYAQKNH